MKAKVTFFLTDSSDHEFQVTVDGALQSGGHHLDSSEFVAKMFRGIKVEPVSNKELGGYK